MAVSPSAEKIRLGAAVQCTRSTELSIEEGIPEWGGQKVTIMMEDDAYLTAQGMRWFRPRQTSFYLIR